MRKNTPTRHNVDHIALLVREMKLPDEASEAFVSLLVCLMLPLILTV